MVLYPEISYIKGQRMGLPLEPVLPGFAYLQICLKRKRF